MKKFWLKTILILIIILIQILLSCFPLKGDMIMNSKAIAVDEITSGEYKYIVEDGNATIKKYLGNKTDIDIPSKIDGYTVTKISRIDNYMVKNFNIPSTVEDISLTAFTTMGPDGEFYFESVNVDSNNNYYSSIDGVLFDKEKKKLLLYPCNKSGEIYNIPEGVEIIESYAFSRNYNLKKIICSNTVQKISWYAIFALKDLEQLEISESVKNISMNAIYYVPKFKSINVSENNENYSSIDGVLYNKDKSKLIKFPDNKSATYIIPSETRIIEDYTFTSNIESLYIPDGVTDLKHYFVFGGRFLKKIRIPDTVKTITDAFKDSTNLVIYCNENSYAEKYAKENNIEVKAIDEYEENISTKKIKFNDKNLYNKVVNGALEHTVKVSENGYTTINMSQTIINKNESELTIEISEDNLKDITEIDIKASEIEDISGLENFTNLEQLYAVSNKIKNIDCISNLVNLRTLNLYENEIEHISCLERLTNLKTLILSFNYVRDITSLSNLLELKKLYLENNRIKDISPLTTLVNLEELDIRYNQIENMDILKDLIKHGNLKTHDERNQRIVKKICEIKEENEYTLPKIFIDAGNCILDNCVLSEDGTKIKFSKSDFEKGVSIKTKIDEHILKIIQNNPIDYIYRDKIEIMIKTKVIDAKNSLISLDADSVEILDLNDKAINDDEFLGTGMKIIVSDDEEILEFHAVIIGDTTGDGKADLKDILAINKHRLNKAKLKDCYLKAGDANDDGIVDIKDILKLNKYRLGKITQI